MPNNTILITPEQTLVAGKSMSPDNISIVLENGHSYDMDTILLLLMKHDKKKIKKPGLTTRFKRATAAFKQALKETEFDKGS